MNLEKWKKAVVHLEGAADSEHYRDRIKRLNEAQALFEKGAISEEDYEVQLTSRSRDLRYQGTAIFLEHNNGHYLLTARHVIWDEKAASRDIEEDIKRYSTWPEASQERLFANSKENALNRIFSIIFRVPSLNEAIRNNSRQEFLMNLESGVPSHHPYTFSNPEIDLAIISLNQRDNRFAQDLLKEGYIPIKLEDIASEPDEEGQNVFTIGFPGATAVLGQLPKHPADRGWSSSYVSLPVSSFGKVSMLNEHLDFFWTDISIYPGNSGGPIVCNDKLVGIVSAQATIILDNSSENLTARIPFGKIIKAKHLNELISIQEEKDRNAIS